MKQIMKWLTSPPVDAPSSTVLLRLMAGGVFLWEGILKFVYVNQGIGRFTKLGHLVSWVCSLVAAAPPHYYNMHERRS